MKKIILSLLLGSVFLFQSCAFFSKVNNGRTPQQEAILNSDQQQDPLLESGNSNMPVKISVFFGPNMNTTVMARIQDLLKQNIKPAQLSFQESCPQNPDGTSAFVELHFGETAVSQKLIPSAEKNNLNDEGFILRAARQSTCLQLVADAKVINTDSYTSKRGLSYGSYALMQEIGFRFLNPLKPTADRMLFDFNKLAQLNRTENPRWPTRVMHLHTMHPLELTNVLNGYGVTGPQDAAGWHSMLSYWDNYMEWLLAHKQNGVEWMLLWDPNFNDFNQSPLRQSRLKILTDMSKGWGITPGIVAPLRFVQQNGWTLLRNQKSRVGSPTETQDNLKEIKGNLDWLLAAGFTAIGGEMGEGEFSSAPPSPTLNELNSIGDYLSAKKIPYRVKIHTSTGQVAQGYKDPQTGSDINFNYLPLYAKSSIGVEPHTVEIYSLDDPAPTYGNKNFLDMLRFTKMAAAGTVRGQKREVLFYPETAYWVSYDVDVPLFLPVYPYRRVHDLRLIAQDEETGAMSKTKSKINGQVVFASGWEWGYWLNDAVAAEASWNPHVEAKTSLDAFSIIVSQILKLPTTSPIIQQLTAVADHQHKLLVLGQVQGRAPADTDKRTGIAYLAGVDVWDEVGMFAKEKLVSVIPGIDKLPLTQPNKFRDDWVYRVPYYMDTGKYKSDLQPLLHEMRKQFDADAFAFASFAQDANQPLGLQFYLREMADGLQIDAYRADFVEQLYEARMNPNLLGQYDTTSLQQTLTKAQAVARNRLNQIALRPEHRHMISQWESSRYVNPTDYHFGYLWTAYNLFYWQREFNKISMPLTQLQLCYMNIVKVSEVESKPGSTIEIVEQIAKMMIPTEGCAGVPTSEPNIQSGW